MNDVTFVFSDLGIVLIGSKVLDLLVSSRFLPSELVAREGQDPELRIFLCQLHQLAVVDVSLASSGGHVDDDQDLALVLGQTDSLAINICHFELIHGGEGGGAHVDRSSRLELLAWLTATTRLLICDNYIK